MIVFIQYSIQACGEFKGKPSLECLVDKSYPVYFYSYQVNLWDSLWLLPQHLGFWCLPFQISSAVTECSLCINLFLKGDCSIQCNSGIWRAGSARTWMAIGMPLTQTHKPVLSPTVKKHTFGSTIPHRLSLLVAFPWVWEIKLAVTEYLWLRNILDYFWRSCFQFGYLCSFSMDFIVGIGNKTAKTRWSMLNNFLLEPNIHLL